MTHDAHNRDALLRVQRDYHEAQMAEHRARHTDLVQAAQEAREAAQRKADARANAPRAYHDALHALKLEHDRALADLQRMTPANTDNYSIMQAGITAKYQRKVRELNAAYGMED